MANQANLTQTIKDSFFSLMKDVATQVPGHILAFDSASQLAQVQIGIQRVIVGGATVTPSPIIECPVWFAGNSEWLIEHEVSPYDEGIIFFSQRCIDGWREQGGVAPNPVARFHDINDALFLPGFRSRKNAISDFAGEGLRIRNKDNDAHIWLKNDGQVYIKGTLNVEGDVIASGDVIGGDISLQNHGTLPGTFKAGSTPVTGEGGKPT